MFLSKTFQNKIFMLKCFGMEISSLSLFNFRNWLDGKIEFGKNINILVGDNAQGKTNVLEAIFFCAIGKSTRSRDKELVNFEKENSKITVFVQKKFGKTKIEIYLFKKQKKAIKINGIPISKIGQLMGELNCVFFSPDELKLVKETPEDRRRFLDIHLSQTDKTYFYLLGTYDKILNNRNKIIKNCKIQPQYMETLPIWNEKLAETASKIIAKRLQFIQDLKPYAKKVHQTLSNNKEDLCLEYSSNIDVSKDTKQHILDTLEKNLEKDIALGYTSCGPHRDDLKITLDGKDTKNFASQGQQRSCALSLKLAELELITQSTGEKPILLLDDVFSELDKSRRAKLLQFAKNYQTIITCTDVDKITTPCKIIKIKNGNIQ